MGLAIRTFLIAVLFALLIFILGANDVFSIKDDFSDFALEDSQKDSCCSEQ